MSKNKIKLIFMMIFSILILVGIILMISMIKSIKESDRIQADNVNAVVDNNVEGDTNIPIPSDMVFPTPEPSSELGENGQMIEIGIPPETVVILSGTDDQLGQKEEADKGERYQAVKKDVSWEQAKEEAEKLGGHLVTIESAEELKTVIQYCINSNIDYCWIGCHREEGKYIWENDENIDINGLKSWGYKEPSYTDQGVAEDYIMLWWMNGKWCLNDSENDPLSRFPKDYEGKLGYVVEFSNR